MEFIDLERQYERIKGQVDSRLASVLSSGRYIMGPEVGELESRLSDYVGVRHCIAVSSGTDALLLSLIALGIGAGDEVVTTAFSFFATAEVIALLGAKPVYVDIDPETCNMDVTAVEGALTERTRAIIAVDLYGQCADYSELMPLATRHGIPVIEDGAQSFGATHHGNNSCALANLGCTSFFPSKPLGGYGDSGAVFTDDDDLADALRQLRVHGQSRRYRHDSVGINGRMDTLQAAVLLAKLDIFDEEVSARQVVAKRYDVAFDAAGVERILVLPENSSVYAQYTIQVDGRDEVVSVLNGRGIPSAVHYSLPLYRQKAVYDDSCNMAATERACTRVLSLPMHPYLESGEQKQVVQAVIESVGGTNSR